MPNQGQIIRITVLTTDGTTHVHDSENTPQNQTDIAQSLESAMGIIADGHSGSLILSQPFALYNVRHIIRISRAIVD